MRRVKENYKLCVLLYIFWIGLTMNFHFTNLLVGLIISVIVSIGSNDILYDKSGYKIRIPKILNMVKFIVRLIFEIYKSSFSYIVRIIKNDCDPVFVNIKLNTNNPVVVTLISNAITLTPGTLTVDVDKNNLLILSIEDPNKRGYNLAEEIKVKYERLFK